MSFLSDTKIGFFDEYSYLCVDVKWMYMKINALKRYVFLLVLGMLSFSGCAGLRKIQDMEVKGFKVESVSPRGFKGAVLKASLELDNPAMEIALSEINGTLEHSGKVLGNVTVDPVVLHAKSVETYSINADMSLGEGASLLDLGKLLDKKTLEECTVDLQAVVKIGKKAPRPLRFEDVPVKKLMDLVKK